MTEKVIELSELIDQIFLFQNHHKMTRVNDLNVLKSRVYYFGFHFSGANFLMIETFIS